MAVCVWLLSLASVFRVRSCYTTCQVFPLLRVIHLPWYGRISLFTQLSVDRHLGFISFWLLCCYEHPCTSVCMNIRCKLFLATYLGVELLGHMVTVLDNLKCYQAVSRSDCITFHSHQQCLGISVFPVAR